MAVLLTSVNLPRALVSTEQLLKYCADFYKRDGFVKWSDVARALGISRQAVHLRVKQAVAAGDLDEATFELYQSMSSRRAAARTNEELRRDQAKRRPQILFTPENYTWLRAESELRRVTISDLVNGLVNRARTQNE